MVFSDLTLAQRLERTEGIASAKYVEARRRIVPSSGAVWMEVAGAFAMFDGPDSPLSQTFGLGLFAPPSDADLDQIEEFFRSRGAAVNHEVSPLAGIGLAASLVARGYQPVEFTSVMHSAVAPIESSANGVSVRRIHPGEERLWSEVSADGWSDNPEFRAFLLELGGVVAATEGALAFVAEIDAQPVATAVLRCDNGVALFGGASTIPRARNRGAQRALLEARMNYAAQAGCGLAMMCAAPGSASQRNAERQGFRIAYTRTKWSRS